VPNVLLPTDRESLAHLDDDPLWAFYLHGDAAKPETCVLSARAYRHLSHGAPAWRDSVEGLLRGRHLLFLGTSLSEPHLLAMLDEFREHFQPESGRNRHWWLGVPARSLDGHKLSRHGVEVVDYKDHSLLPDILSWLATSARGEGADHAPADAERAPEPPPFDPRRPWFFVPFTSKREGMVGREAGLARVAERLSSAGTASIGQTAAFTGIGGIGKTQLAVEYCWEHREDYPGGVYWFTADQDIDSQVIRLSDEARWVHPATEPATKLQIAQHRLRSSSDALFVYDNLEKPVSFADLRPEHGRGCHLLLTSRLEQPAFPRIEVDLLRPEQALDLLTREARREPGGADEQVAAEEICAYLDGLPLALELAGAYLDRRPTRSFREYADLLKRRGLETTERAEAHFGDRSATGYKARLADALRVSGPLLDEHPDLDRLLDILAWSGPASMGWPLLLALVQPADPDELRDGADLAATLKVLRREDGVDRGSSPRFRMHRLVQEVRRRERPASAQPAAAIEMLRGGARWFEDMRRDFRNLEAYEAELDHLEQWIGLADLLEDADARVRLRWLRAYPAWHRGRYSESLVEIDAALGLFEALKVDASLLSAHLLADRGGVLSKLGRHPEALNSSESALRLRLAALGEAHPDTAMALNNVGGALFGLGRQEEALEYAIRALDIWRKTLGERHPDTAMALINVGGALFGLRRHKEALEHQTRALDIWRKTLGERHPDTATAHNNLGDTLGRLGRHQEARRHLSQALELRRNLLGERHPDTIATCISLLVTLHKLRLRDEVFKLARATLDRIDRATPRCNEVVHAYNSSKPQGFRDLPLTGPTTSSSRSKKKKR